MSATPKDDLLIQLVDIKGLDHIDWWPVAPIWWILAGSIAAVALISLIVWIRRRIYARSWKGDASRTLAALESRLDGASAREIADALSATLRRIAMQRHSRAECAGLEGYEWLRWLEKHDPRGFDWTTHGRLLTEIPYAPPEARAQPEKIRVLIDAVRPWVA